jgi:hypothetical protein
MGSGRSQTGSVAAAAPILTLLLVVRDPRQVVLLLLSPILTPLLVVADPRQVALLLLPPY